MKSSFWYLCLLVLFWSKASWALFDLKETAQEKIDAIAPYCSYYRDINDDSVVKETKNKIKSSTKADLEVYRFNGSEAVVNYSDLLKYRFAAKSYRLKVHSEHFKKKLLTWVSYLNIESKRQFYSAFAFPGLAKKEKKLNSCLQQRVSGTLASRNAEIAKLAVDNEAFEVMLSDYFIGTIRLGAILDRRQFVIDEFDKAIAEKTKQGLSLAGGRGLRYQKKLKAIKTEIKYLEENKEGTLASLRIESFDLIQNYPLLFDYGAGFSLMNFLKTYIKPSGFYKMMIEDLDPDVWKGLKNHLNMSQDLKMLPDLLMAPELAPALEKYFNRKIVDKNLRAAAKNSAKNYLNKILDNSLDLCEDDEHKLHYNPQLVETIFQKNLSSHLFKELTVKDQAAYCYLLENDPPYSNSVFSRLEKYGMYSAGAGSISQIVSGRWSWAIKFYSAAFALFAVNSWDELSLNSSLLSSSFSLVPHGYLNAEQYEEYLNERGEIVTSILYELGFSGLGIYALHYLDSVLMRKMAEAYDPVKHHLKPALVNYQFLALGKVKEGLFKLGGVKGRDKYYKLMMEKTKLITQMKIRYKISDTLQAIREKIGQYNFNYDWPAYAIYYRKKSNLDEYLSVVSRNIQATARGKKNLENLIERLKSMDSRMDILVKNTDMAFNASMLQERYAKIFKALKSSDFSKKATIENVAGFPGAQLKNGILTVRFRIIENGKRRWSYRKISDGNGEEIEALDSFGSISDLKGRLSELEAQAFSSVSSSIVHESGAWSKYLDESYQYALDHQMIRISAQKLESLKVARGLNAQEQEVLDLMNKVLGKGPRVDLQNRLLLFQLPYESWDLLKAVVPFVKKRSLGKNLTVDSLDPTQRELGVFGRFLNRIPWAFMLPVGTSLYTTYVMMNQNGSDLHIWSEKVYYDWLNLQRAWWYKEGLPSEVSAVKMLETKEFLAEYRTLAFREIAYEWSISIRDRQPFYKNISLKRKLDDFAYHIVRLRKLYRIPELRKIIDGKLDVAYRDSMIVDLVEKIERELPESVELERELLGVVVFSLLTYDTPSEFRYLVEKFRGQMPDAVLMTILRVVKDQKQIQEKYQEIVSLPNFVQEFIEDDLDTPGIEQEGMLLMKFFDQKLKNAFELHERDALLQKRVDYLMQESFGQAEEKAPNDDIQKVVEEILRLDINNQLGLGDAS
ncbi:MAG: hypothetical protein CL674_08915 [Bdellovibrionaceae bacterium]|mgnify:CR=1 FL=1|nr:hypothetical protein [Pseudobdellovibrionaceae bacterium]